MKRFVTSVVVLGFAVVALWLLSTAATAAELSKDRVVVMYFHRTHRCPTCLKMGGYSEEAVTTGFARELKNGKVEFHYIDFQDERNAELTKGYKVSGPTLLMARVAGDKVARYKNLTEIWTKVGDKEAFIEYVQGNVKDYQK
jgi:hypothetical protein